MVFFGIRTIFEAEVFSEGIHLKFLLFLMNHSEKRAPFGWLGYVYLEPVCPLFWGLNPQKEGLFRSNQGSFGFQVTADLYKDYAS